MALSVRTTAAALTRTTLPAAESGRPLTRRLAAACMTSGTMATMTLAVAIGIAIGIELSAARAEREVRRLALRIVSFGSRQLCANQRTMDGPIVAFITAGRTLIERVGLGHRLSHQPAKLSGGEAQRVAIARALVGRPSIVFADEPTGNLDTRSGAEIVGLLRELNDEGKTIVVITHDRDIAAAMPRRVEVRDGLVVS